MVEEEEEEEVYLEQIVRLQQAEIYLKMLEELENDRRLEEMQKQEEKQCEMMIEEELHWQRNKEEEEMESTIKEKADVVYDGQSAHIGSNDLLRKMRVSIKI